MARTNKQYRCKIPLLPPYRRNPSARDQSFPSLPWAGSRGEDPLLCVCSLSAISINNNQKRVSRTLLRLWLSQWHYSTQNFTYIKSMQCCGFGATSSVASARHQGMRGAAGRGEEAAVLTKGHKVWESGEDRLLRFVRNVWQRNDTSGHR